MRKFRPARFKPKLLLPLIILAVAALVVLLLHHRHTSPTIPSSNPLAGNEVSSSPQASSDNARGTSQPPSQGSSPSSEAGPPPITPYGNFVSNHHPGGESPTSEASTCNTSAGATCYIEFTNGSTVKKLDAQTADSKGSAIWYWDVKSAGLSAGSWTITAVASLNGQIKTANDSLPLVIQ